MADNPFNTPVDSLPYYDRDLDDNPNLRNQLNSLIAVELRSILPKTATSTPANLSHLAAPRPLPSSPFLAGELARVQSKKPIPPGEGLDTKRYAMPPPTGKAATTVEAWEKAYESSLAQLEHQRLRAINGNLLNQLGANAWRVQNFAMENTVERVNTEGEEVRKAVEDINRDRKRKQEKGGETLTRLEKRWTELVSGNMQLEIGCMALCVHLLFLFILGSPHEQSDPDQTLLSETYREAEVAQLQSQHAELQARLQAM